MDTKPSFFRTLSYIHVQPVSPDLPVLWQCIFISLHSIPHKIFTLSAFNACSCVIQNVQYVYSCMLLKDSLCTIAIWKQLFLVKPQRWPLLVPTQQRVYVCASDRLPLYKLYNNIISNTSSTAIKNVIETILSIDKKKKKFQRHNYNIISRFEFHIKPPRAHKKHNVMINQVVEKIWKELCYKIQNKTVWGEKESQIRTSLLRYWGKSS